MNNKSLFGIALILGLVGCTYAEEEEIAIEQESDYKLVFSADCFKDGDEIIDTKTSVLPNETYSSYQFLWSAQDTVGIYPDAGSQIYFTMVGGAGAGTAEFDGGAWSCKDGHEYRSYYPFIANIYLDATRIPVSFTGQSQVGNTNSDHFKQCDFMYTGVTSKAGGSLSFSYHHLVTVVSPWIELPAGHFTGLTLSLDDPLFVTKGYYDLTAATPAIVGTQFSNTMHIDLDVTLVHPDILRAFVLLAPMDMTGHTLTITVTDENSNEYEYTYNPSKAYVAANVYRLRSAISFASQNISFADDVVKAICVDNWDTNGDGELSYSEAEAVTSIPQSVFAGNTTITSFDEFQYFTGLTSLSYTEERDEGEYDYFGTFYNCTSLASIVLPSSLQTISVASFRGCTALTSITIPASVTRIQSMAFLGCTNLDVYMESETPCQLTVDPHGTYDHPYSFGFLANGLVKTIYVPTEACLDTYKNATYWTSYKWRIKWVNEFVPSVPVPEAVDLGLSVKWASFNVGATAQEESGDYYAWGGIEPYYSSLDPLTWKDGKESGYDLSSYLWYDGDKYTKYCMSSSLWGGTGNYDRECVLEFNDDVAHVALGDKWRMPTYEEWMELKDNCTITWTNINGVFGRRYTSNIPGYTEKWVFLPVSGYFGYGTSLYESSSYYWSSSLNYNQGQIAEYNRCAFALQNTNSSNDMGIIGREKGGSVRPIYDDNLVRVSGITVSETTLQINPGENFQLTAMIQPMNASNQHVNWSTSDDTMAKVDNNGLVQVQLRLGQVAITATAADGGYSSICNVTIVAPEPAAVDLGLSVKWASFNVGAIHCVDAGSYYAWGETETKNDYSWDSYSFRISGYDNNVRFSKYNTKDNNGTIDGLTELEPVDDVAHILWGGNWRMPTASEFQELIDNCTITVTDPYVVGEYGYRGYTITSNIAGYTDKSIFIPSAGENSGTSVSNRSVVLLWTSSLDSSNPTKAKGFSTYPKGVISASRNIGRCIRPVYDE